MDNAMKRHSFFLKLFLGNLVIIGLVLGVGAAVTYRSLDAEFLHTTYAYQDYLAEIAQQYLERVWPLPDAEIDRICDQFVEAPPEEGAPADAAARSDRGLPERMTVIARDGRVLGDSFGNPSTPAAMESHKAPSRPEFLAALEGRPGHAVRRSETVGIEFRYVALPIRHQGEVVGAVRVAMPVAAIHQGEAVLRDALLWTVAMAVATFALLGLLINWIWFRPLKRLTQAARRMASGDLQQRALVYGPEELAHLGLALNALRDNLVQQIETVTAQRENLEKVVANLREGVVAADAAGRIVLMNRAAVDLLAANEGDLVGRPLEAVVRAAAVVDVYHRAMAAGRPVGRQIEMDVKSRRCDMDVLAFPVASGKAGLSGLVVMRDVTELVRAAAMKAEFAANASHELRTPLATLRAAIDALAACDPADRDGLAKITAMLDRHVRRLENLTADLLNLHVVETAREELELGPVRFDSLEEWLRAQFADGASRRGVALEFNVSAPAEAVTTDRKLLHLVLQNLVDNAIKFTPAGGRVTVSMGRGDRQTQFRVADTGVGIGRADLPHVFERFFQADAARSGDTGERGTGLGLAIVKHACERLGAKVAIESELGRGTTVTVLAPDRPAAEPDAD
jgi:two-component system phosphate regulon sensor histidine kinase PhoR